MDPRSKQCEKCNSPTIYNDICFQCRVKSSPGKTIAPNGLPIMCLRADGTKLENSHADHPNYMFPITVEYRSQSESFEMMDEEHAVVFLDDSVALTLYEHCYFLWKISNNTCIRAPWGEEKRYRISASSIEKLSQALSKETNDEQ